MNEYKVTIDNENHVTYIEGNIITGSIPINIPDSEPCKREYISLFLNKGDLEIALEYLKFIDKANDYRANEAFFVSALSNFIKCFSDSNGRKALSRERFKQSLNKNRIIDPNEFDKYLNWRNKHFIHDENGMTEVLACFIIAPESSAQLFGGPPSVIYNHVNPDYIAESSNLRILIEHARAMTISKIDDIGDKLAKKYGVMSREEILSFGEAEFKIATFKSPDGQR